MSNLARLVLIAGLLVLVSGCHRSGVNDSSDENSSPDQNSSSDRVEPFTPLTLLPIDPPAAVGALAPELSLDSRGGAILTWFEPSNSESGDSLHTLRLSRWTKDGWSAPRTIHRGADSFANWADRPAAVEIEHLLVAHHLRKLGSSTYAYGVMLTASGDGGETWQDVGLLHDDASPTEHGFVSWVKAPGGNLHAFWLDGRAMADNGPMQLRTTQLEPGQLLGSQGTSPPPSTLLDDRVCECCNTAAAWTAGGPLVAYRDRSPTEIRDLAVVRRDGDAWSAPTLLAEDGWEIQGCPVNGPAMAARNERVAVAWYSAPDQRPRVRLAFSENSGLTWSEPLDIAGGESAAGELPLGRLSLVLDAQGGAVVSWLQKRGEAAGIFLRRARADGTLEAPQEIVVTTPGRRSGVPRLLALEPEASGEPRLLLAWIEDNDPGPDRLRAAQLVFPTPG